MSRVFNDANQRDATDITSTRSLQHLEYRTSANESKSQYPFYATSTVDVTMLPFRGLSVCLSVCHVRVLCSNGRRYRHVYASNFALFSGNVAA